MHLKTKFLLKEAYQSKGIHLNIDLRKQKHDIGYSLLSESHSISSLNYNHLEAFAERCCIHQKQNRKIIRKWGICQYGAKCIAAY